MVLNIATFSITRSGGVSILLLILSNKFLIDTHVLKSPQSSEAHERTLTLPN